MRPFIFIHTHPIQYFAPLYQYLISKGMALQVWYCAAGSRPDGYDAEFGQAVQWDIPLLEGYSYRIFPNKASAAQQAAKGFSAFHNPAMLQALQQEPPSIVVVHGWNYRTYVQLLQQAKRYGHQLAFRAETNAAMEMARPRWQQLLRKYMLRYLLRHVDYFLYIGQQSKQFYTRLGIPQQQLHCTPYAVDNQRFQHAAQQLHKSAVREQLRLPAEASIFLCSGKYIDKKRPMDVLRAFAQLRHPQAHLLMMGEGALRPQMEAFMQAENIAHLVTLTGFINQKDVANYYAAADAFIMSSDYGETWGLSVNEAMNFGLPLILSHRVGCAPDLLLPGQNGWQYTCGNVDALQQCMQAFLHTDAGTRAAMQAQSLRRINQYNFAAIEATLRQLAADRQ
ncbi:MAG: glycosyltransferase family 4 protein [Bacteroidetes bacterium]|jgi:Glycosyltransferase|uniref:glycosyltransferase family 4 protein n=1 Tax=Phnomibacter sp. TaxID=2836217 RepID=UPI002FDD8B41|nr:glycosyltransferase family 4 protein [Bacteroidota bacterium]